MNNNKKENQKIEIYLDYGTLPSLFYFHHFIQNRNEKETIRIFGLHRYKISDEVISSYPEGVIQFRYFSEETQQETYQLIDKVLSSNEASCYEINVHLNLLHSQKNLFRLFHDIFSQYEDKIKNIHLYFYDDGSAGLVNLLNIERSYSAKELQGAIEKEINVFSTLKYDTFSLEDFNDLSISAYLWGNRIPSTYYFLDESKLNKQELQPLRESIKNYKSLDFNWFNDMNEEEKTLLFKLLNLNIEEVNPIIDYFSQNNVFLFMGTSLQCNSPSDEDSLYKMHIDAILNYIHPTGHSYLGNTFSLAIKCHPGSPILAQRIKDSFPNAMCLPPHIPFEILYLLGCKPNKIGGFVSTVSFFVPKETLANLIFVTHPNQEKRGNHPIFLAQYDLRSLMLDTGIIEEKSTHFHEEAVRFL